MRTCGRDKGKHTLDRQTGTDREPWGERERACRGDGMQGTERSGMAGDSFHPQDTPDIPGGSHR